MFCSENFKVEVFFSNDCDVLKIFTNTCFLFIIDIYVNIHMEYFLVLIYMYMFIYVRISIKCMCVYIYMYDPIFFILRMMQSWMPSKLDIAIFMAFLHLPKTVTRYCHLRASLSLEVAAFCLLDKSGGCNLEEGHAPNHLSRRFQKGGYNIFFRF